MEKQLKEIEQYFKSCAPLEARALIYKLKESNEYKIILPLAKNTSYSTTSDIDFTHFDNKGIWDLAYDLHSHHTMGAFFSSTDDNDDRDVATLAPSCIFGVFSWKCDDDTWKFRTIENGQFKPLEEN